MRRIGEKIRVKKRAAIRFEMAPHWAKNDGRHEPRCVRRGSHVPHNHKAATEHTTKERRRDCTSVVEWDDRNGMCKKIVIIAALFRRCIILCNTKKSFATGNRAPFKRQRKTRDIDCTSVILEWIHRHACNMRMRYASVSYFFWVRIKSALWGFIPR